MHQMGGISHRQPFCPPHTFPRMLSSRALIADMLETSVVSHVSARLWTLLRMRHVARGPLCPLVGSLSYVLPMLLTQHTNSDVASFRLKVCAQLSFFKTSPTYFFSGNILETICFWWLENAAVKVEHYQEKHSERPAMGWHRKASANELSDALR